MDFVGAATGKRPYRGRLGIPLMIFPYIGALKSWIYIPIFALCGVSAESIRLPVMVISCGTLVFGYALVRRNLTPGWATAFTAACVVYPGFVMQTRWTGDPSFSCSSSKHPVFVCWSNGWKTPSFLLVFSRGDSGHAVSDFSTNPNPVPAGPDRRGRTTINWQTGDGTIGEVYVVTNGGAETLFAGVRRVEPKLHGSYPIRLMNFASTVERTTKHSSGS